MRGRGRTLDTLVDSDAETDVPAAETGAVETDVYTPPIDSAVEHTDVEETDPAPADDTDLVETVDDTARADPDTTTGPPPPPPGAARPSHRAFPRSKPPAPPRPPARSVGCDVGGAAATWAMLGLALVVRRRRG